MNILERNDHAMMTSWNGTHWPQYCPFVQGIHWLPVDSQHKGPEIPTFSCLFIVTLYLLFSKQLSYQWNAMPQRLCDVTLIQKNIHCITNKIRYFSQHFSPILLSNQSLHVPVIGKSPQEGKLNQGINEIERAHIWQASMDYIEYIP